MHLFSRLFSRCNQIGEARYIFDKNRITLSSQKKIQAMLKLDQSGEYHQAQVAFGIDNERHNFPRATRGYTPHKIYLHSWRTYPLRSVEVPRGLRGRRDIGVAIDQHPRNFISRKKRGGELEDSSSFRVYSDCPWLYRYAS